MTCSLCSAAPRFATPIDTLAYLISAIVHDFDHPGYNNAYLVTTSNPIAITHNDSSVLERHHCSESFKIIMQEECNIFANIPEPEYVVVVVAVAWVFPA